MRRFLKSTTSLVLCASLVLPLPYAGPVAAQEGLPQCGDKAKDTPLPCLMGETVVETKRDWRVANLIRNGKAASVEEAEQILAERRAQRQQEKEAEAAAEMRRECRRRGSTVNLPVSADDSEWAYRDCF